MRNSAKESTLIILVLADVTPLARALHKILSLINMQKVVRFAALVLLLEHR